MHLFGILLELLYSIYAHVAISSKLDILPDVARLKGWGLG